MDPAVHRVPREAASRGEGGGGQGGVSDYSRGQEQRRVIYTEPRAERHRVPLPADSEKAIRLAGRYRKRQEAGRATGPVHARRRASGIGALDTGPDAWWRAACTASDFASWSTPAAC